jgi:nucleoside-diphosphate-sugar epimerase
VKRVLLTGATGFVGANLARRLLADGHEVHCLVRPGHARWRLEGIAADVHVHEAVLTDGPGLTALVARLQPEWVFHLAVHGAYPTQADLDAMFATNIVGTMNLVRAALAAGVAAFVNTGSSSEYGFKDHPPAETDWLEPNSHYAVTKASATLFCRYTGQSQGAPIRTLRLYSVYGPWEEPSRLIPTLVVRGLRGELPPLVSPDIARDYIHADDVCDAYVLAATVSGQEPGAVYNLGTGVQTTLREAVEVARATFGIVAEPVWGTMPPRRWDTAVWVADNRTITRALGWRPRADFAEGFRRTVAWYRAHPEVHGRYIAGVA